MDNLTRDEARQRAALLSNVAYQVQLDLTGGDETFGSETTVRFRCATPGAGTFVDLLAPSVQAIALNGRPLPPESFDGSRIGLTDLHAENELRVAATCAYQRTGMGMHHFRDPVDDRVYLYTQFESAAAHRVYPCFDQPDLKATFDFSVLAPAGWEVASNSAPAQRPEHGQAGRWRFGTTPVLSTYVTAIAAGPYHVVRDRHGQIDLGLFCRQSLARYLDADEILEITRQGLDFFQETFDYPYPFGKYDQLFVPEFRFGAMENAGCVTFADTGFLFRSKVTEARRETRAQVILHEMAHMWFGDLVTMRWWDDLWLNESFATIMGYLAQARATRFTNAWTTFATGEKSWAYRQDQLPTTHAIAASIPDVESVELYFDGISYAKGASVIRQLVAWVGEEAFVRGLRTYFRRHEYANTDLAGFLAALEGSSGRDLRAWSQEWLERAGVNTLRAVFETTDGLTPASGSDARRPRQSMDRRRPLRRATALPVYDPLASVGTHAPSRARPPSPSEMERGSETEGEAKYFGAFQIVQEAPADWPTLRSHRVAMGLYDATAEGLVRRRTVEVDTAGTHTPVPQMVGERVPDLVLVNDGDLTYAKIRLDPRSLATVSERLADLRDDLARALCWSATWQMVRDAELAAREYLPIVLNNIRGETDIGVVQQLLGQAQTAILTYGDPANRVSALGALAAGALESLRQAEPGGDRQLAWARSFIGAARSDDHLAIVRGLLDGSQRFEGLAVDTDLRWHIVRALATVGAGGEELIEAELARDPTDEGRRHAAATRAARPMAEAKAQAWAALLEDTALPLATIRSIIGGFQHQEQDALMRSYVPRYFDALAPVWRDRGLEVGLAFAEWMYPRSVVDEAVARATDEYLATQDPAPPIRRLLLEGKDDLQRVQRARAKDAAVGRKS